MKLLSACRGSGVLRGKYAFGCVVNKMTTSRWSFFEVSKCPWEFYSILSLLFVRGEKVNFKLVLAAKGGGYRDGIGKLIALTPSDLFPPSSCP